MYYVSVSTHTGKTIKSTIPVPGEMVPNLLMRLERDVRVKSVYYQQIAEHEVEIANALNKLCKEYIQE